MPSNASSSSSYGRVVRLHFACKAALPIGSTLRVTSSQLWSPGSLSQLDPTDSTSTIQQTSELALPNTTSGNTNEQTRGGGDVQYRQDGELDAEQQQKESYASSVEMVTSPEDWPIWRTRTPVIISLRDEKGARRKSSISSQDDIDATGGGGGGGTTVSKKGRVQKHLYRYLVVTPGAGDAGIVSDEDEDEEGMDDLDQSGDLLQVSKKLKGISGTGTATSGDMLDYSMEVSVWEDPFDKKNKESQSMRQLSTASLPSVKRNDLAKQLSSLPFRTLEIDTNTAKVITDNQSNSAEYTKDGVHIDTWNNVDDASFRPFLLQRQKSIGVPRTRSQMSTYSTITDDDRDVSNERKERIFFVCFHLPVILNKDEHTGQWSAKWAESLLAATEGSTVLRHYQTHWVGTVSCSDHPIVTEEDRESVRVVLEEMNCTPLFLDDATKEAHYLGMCKQVLWPAFHNIDLLDLSAGGLKGSAPKSPKNGTPSNSRGNTPTKVQLSMMNSYYQQQQELLKQEQQSYGDNPPPSNIESDWDQSRLDGWWKAYKKVNHAFMSVLSHASQPGDTIWVHDYHLSLLPKLLDDMEHSKYNGSSVTRKIFFLHIPFPTSQIFRELECGEAILEGMLHADVVGFHAFDHARHFLNATKRILGLTYESLVGGLIGVKLKRKTVLVTMHNVSIEPNMVDAMIASSRVQEGVALYRHKHASRTIIAGIDTAQSLSGIILKLLAFERLLTDYPIWQEKVVLIQKCLLPGSRRADEINTIKQIRYLVRRIQDRFGPSVIACEEVLGSNIPIDQRLSLWKAADVLMVTPIREGLNLMPLEYIFTKKKPAHPGVIISSEFSAVCSVLNGALRVNPFDIQMSVTTLDKALTMDVKEKEERRFRDSEFVASSPSSRWTRNVLRDLSDTAATLNGEDDMEDDESIVSTCLSTYLINEKASTFSHLRMNEVVSSYGATQKRVIFLDLNGTIVFKEPPGKYLKREILGSSGNKPPKEVIQALTVLCADPNNAVYVVSGDSQENVEAAIGNIRGLGLAASNGACFAPPMKPGDKKRDWRYFDLGVDWEAVKAIVLPVLSKYTARTNGSYVKLTHSSIGWSYYSCDPEWGGLQASHLILELEACLRPFDVRFVMIKGIVEIVPWRLNKGLIVQRILREQSMDDKSVDFILTMGDDVHDEKMFTTVSTFISELEDPLNAPPSPPIIDERGSIVVENEFSLEKYAKCVEGKSKDNKLFAFTTAVGKKESHAFAYVNDARDVFNLLIQLSGLGLDMSKVETFDKYDFGRSFSS